jgi:L-ascorbate metabolism protein UlaG (beta-lactamase superfamily)
MKLTKYAHACFTIEEDGKILVVDPGGLSTDFIAPGSVVGVVITHEHFDHLDHDQLASIIDKNPDAIIIGYEAVTSKIEAFQTKPVSASETISIGPFTLAFHGGTHAVIHPSVPTIANLGVVVNDLLYYPGDSFVLPGVPIDTLAVPASAPWMKIAEAMDFLTTIKPRLAFPTHDAMLSDAGKETADAWLVRAAETCGTEYRRLTDTIEI